MRSASKVGLIVVGVGLACVVCGLIVILAYFTHDVRKAGAVSQRFKLGMTIEQLFSVFPADFSYASIGVPLRREPCKNAFGKIVPPETYDVLFPDMKEDDNQGLDLASEAAKLPFRLDRFELLDRHLRARGDWAELIQAWTAYIQDGEDRAGSGVRTPQLALAYCRRGSAYVAHNDFEPGFVDLRKSCKLGCKQGCIAMENLPPDRVKAVEANEKQIVETARACEPAVSSFSLSGPAVGDKFKLTTYFLENTRQSVTTTVSRAELMALVHHEFKDRTWMMSFTYLTGTPMNVSFSFVVGPEGKIDEVHPAQGWD